MPGRTVPVFEQWNRTAAKRTGLEARLDRPTNSKRFKIDGMGSLLNSLRAPGQ